MAAARPDNGENRQDAVLACNPERQFSRAERLRAAGDAAGLQAFTAGALMSGTCISLSPGLAVLAVGQGKGQGVIRIRPKGSFKTFFTLDLVFGVSCATPAEIHNACCISDYIPPSYQRHARACPACPSFWSETKAWMAGASPAMTNGGNYGG